MEWDKIIPGAVLTVFGLVGAWFVRIVRKINTHEAEILAIKESQKNRDTQLAELSGDIKGMSAVLNQIVGKLDG